MQRAWRLGGRRGFVAPDQREPGAPLDCAASDGQLVRVPRGGTTLLPVALSTPSARAEGAPPRARLAGAGVIEIELDVGRVRVRGAADTMSLRTVLEVLAKR